MAVVSGGRAVCWACARARRVFTLGKEGQRRTLTMAGSTNGSGSSGISSKTWPRGGERKRSVSLGSARVLSLGPLFRSGRSILLALYLEVLNVLSIEDNDGVDVGERRHKALRRPVLAAVRAHCVGSGGRG